MINLKYLTDSEYNAVKTYGRELHSMIAHSKLSAEEIRHQRPDIVLKEKDLNQVLKTITGRDDYDIIEWFTHTTPGRTEMNKLINS